MLPTVQINLVLSDFGADCLVPCPTDGSQRHLCLSASAVQIDSVLSDFGADCLVPCPTEGSQRPRPLSVPAVQLVIWRYLILLQINGYLARLMGARLFGSIGADLLLMMA